STRSRRVAGDTARPTRLDRRDLVDRRESVGGKSGHAPYARSVTEDVAELVGGDDFELPVRAIARRFVGAKAFELGSVAKAHALHVVVADFDHELGAERLPRQVFAGAPTTLGARHALALLLMIVTGPLAPRVVFERVFSVRREELSELFALLL